MSVLFDPDDNTWVADNYGGVGMDGAILSLNEVVDMTQYRSENEWGIDEIEICEHPMKKLWRGGKFVNTRVLSVDLEARSLKGVRTALAESGLPAPTAIVDHGKYKAIWRMDKPFPESQRPYFLDWMTLKLATDRPIEGSRNYVKLLRFKRYICYPVRVIEFNPDNVYTLKEIAACEQSKSSAAALKHAFWHRKQ